MLGALEFRRAFPHQAPLVLQHRQRDVFAEPWMDGDADIVFVDQARGRLGVAVVHAQPELPLLAVGEIVEEVTGDERGKRPAAQRCAPRLRTVASRNSRNSVSASRRSARKLRACEPLPANNAEREHNCASLLLIRCSSGRWSTYGTVEHESEESAGAGRRDRRCAGSRARGSGVMKDFIRIVLVVAAAGLSGACGGVGGGAAQNGDGAAAPPATAVAGGWDSWDWDAGAWSE
jgi:hypothetical protein